MKKSFVIKISIAFVFSLIILFTGCSKADALVNLSNSNYAYIGSMGYDIVKNGGARNCSSSGCTSEIGKSVQFNFIEFTQALQFVNYGVEFYVTLPETLLKDNMYNISMIICFSHSVSASDVIPRINHYEVPKGGDNYLIRLNDLQYTPTRFQEGYSPQNYCYMAIGSINANRGGGTFGFQIKSSSGTRGGSLLGYRYTWLGATNGLSTNDIQSIVSNSTTTINNNTSQKFSQVNNSINQMNSDISQGLDEVNNTQKETNKKLDKLDDTLKKEDYDSSRYGELSGLLPPGPLDSLLSLPITLLGNLLNSLNSNSCTTFDIPLPFVNSSFSFPCFKTIFQDIGIWEFYNTFIGSLATALILYYYLSNFSKRVQALLLLKADFVNDWGGA